MHKFAVLQNAKLCRNNMVWYIFGGLSRIGRNLPQPSEPRFLLRYIAEQSNFLRNNYRKRNFLRGLYLHKIRCNPLHRKRNRFHREDKWERVRSCEAGKDVSAFDRDALMSVDYDDSELAAEADERIRTFQADSAREAGIFHHLITLPTYHTAALSTDNLAKEYFGEQGMLGYVKGVQRKEIRQGIACVKHQNMAGSDMGDDHKEYFAGEAALKAGGKDNTMNQFG